MFHPGLLVLLIGTCLAEDKWVWSRNHGIDDRRDRTILDQSRYDNFLTYENNRVREYQRQRDREYDRIRDRDYERQQDREPTTRRPPFYGRPEQQHNNNNDDYDDYDASSQDDKFNHYGPKYAGGPPGAYPGGGGGAGGSGAGYGGFQNLIPNPQNGILVGPGGPTGIIGRPAGFRQEYGNAAIGDATLNHLRPDPANGILVGPGGPTGSIGRPPPQNGQFPIGQGLGAVGPQIFPGVGAQPQGQGSTGPQLFPGVGAQPQGNGPVRPQVFPTVGGQFFQPNPNFSGGPGRGDIYQQGGNYGAGYPFGYPGGIGGGLYPDIYSGQRQPNGYGFYPAQYYPNIPYGDGQGAPGQIPYNNDIAGDINNNNYAPGYNFGIEGKSNGKKNDNIKATTNINDKNVVKKSIDNKLLKF